MGNKESKPKPRGPPRELVAKNDYLKKQLRGLNSTLRRIQRNINEINYAIRSKKRSIVLMEREIRNLNKSIKGYTDRYNSAKSLIRQYNREIKQLQAEKKKLDGEIKRLNKEFASLQAIIEQVDDGNIDMEYELDLLLEEHNKVKGVSIDNDEKYYDLLTVQNNHLNREYDYLKNDLTKGDQASTFVQPKIQNWELANHFFRVAYYVFALVLLLFLYQHFSMKRLYPTIIIILLIGLYPFYILHIERFLYRNIMYVGKFITATPVK